MDPNSFGPVDRDLLIRTVIGESAGQPVEGQAAVANVILNRAQSGAYGGSRVRDVVLAPKQFEPWDTRTRELLAYAPTSPKYQQAAQIVDGVLSGDIPDTSDGATHFLNPDIVRQRRGGSLPSWAREQTATIGGHAFYAPKGRITRVASAGDTPVSQDAPAAGGLPDDLELVPNGPAAASAKPALPDDLELVPAKPATFAERFSNGPMASDQGKTNDPRLKPLDEALRAKADTELVGEPSLANQAATAVLRAGNTVGLNLPRNAAAAIASLPGVGNGRGFEENYRLAKDQEAALSRQNPVSSAIGTGVGIGGAIATLPVLGAEQIAGRALPAALSSATATGRVAQAAATGAGYAGAETLADTKDLGDAAKSAAIGGAAGGVLGAAGERLAKAYAKWQARPRSPVSESGAITPEATAAMSAAGVDPANLTPESLATMQRVLVEKGVSPDAAREAMAKAFGIDLTKGQAGGDFSQQQFERIAARGGFGEGPQKVLGEFFARQADQTAAAKAGIGEQLAGAHPEIAHPLEAGEAVAGGALAHFDDAAARAAAAEGGADAALMQARGARPADDLQAAGAIGERARAISDQAAEAERAALAQGDQALAGVRGEQPADAITAGTAVGDAVRGRAAAARDNYRQAYDAVAQSPGTFEPGALDRVGTRVRERLGTDVPVDPVLTPNAARALGDLDNLPGLLRTEGEAGPSLQAVDQARKRLVAYYRGTAANPTDRRAMREVLSQFDNHVEDALSAGLFSGDDAALGQLREARRLFSQYQQTFRPTGAGDDVGRAMQRIVEQDAQPQEIANFLYGSSQVGSTGLSSRLAERVRTVLDANSPEWAAVRQGLISRALGEGTPEQIAARAEHLTEGPGRVLTNRILTGEQIGGLRAYQRAVEQAEAARQSVPDWVSRLAANDFNPRQIADELYGASGAGRASSLRFLDAVGRLVGRDSPEWAGLGQGLLARALGDGDRGTMASRVDDLLSGSGRDLANRLLSPEQIAGLRTFQQGARQAEEIRGAVPDWIQGMARGEFNPQSALDGLIGTGAPGIRATSVPLARAVRGFFGSESPQWSAVRQAAWQRLTAKPEGMTEDFGSQALANRIADFVSGKGKALAETLYSPKELELMRGFASIMRTVTPPKGASPNSDTAPAIGAMLSKLSGRGNQIAALLGAAHGGPMGMVAGYGIGKGLEKAAKTIADRGRTAMAVDATKGAPVTLDVPEPVRIDWSRISAGPAVARD